jgi:signal transduction histidine kinase
LRPEDVADNIAPMNLLIHRDDLQLFIDAIALSAAYISPLRIEFRVEHTDKGELWIESRAMPKVEPDGSVVWHGFMHDITARKQTDSALQLNRKNLSEAQRIGQMGSWELNVASGALAWSDEIYRIFELDPGVFGASYDAFLNPIHPDDRDAVNRAYTASVANHTPYSIDHRLLFPDGRIKHVRECCETHYDENGKPRHSHGTVQDITALKVSEQKLKDTQEKLRQLVLSREAIHEDERKHISWEMHEELGQLLAAAKMRISGMRTQLPKDNLVLKEDSRVIVNLLDKSIKTIRDLASDLRPTVLLHGIAPALEWLVAEFNQHPDMICEFETNENGTPVSEELSTLVFRVVQESLENIARHAGVLRVLVAWESNQHGHVLTLRHDGYANASDIADNQSLSFFGIQERVKALGGEVRIFSELEYRSVIEVSFPVGGVVAR